MVESGQLERYLGRVRGELRGLPAAQVSDIIDELRSHIRESASRAGPPDQAAIAEALRRLGSPTEIAALYGIPAVRPRPARWLALALTIGAGYGFAAVLVIAAINKPFSPDQVGLWQLADDQLGFSLNLGFGDDRPAGRELLGWWITPLGLLIGGGLGWLTTRSAWRRIRRWRSVPDAVTT